jgi:hypothetical protein
LLLIIIARLAVFNYLEGHDHSRIKTLLKRSRQSVSALVTQYNKLVKEMQGLKVAKKAPRGWKVPKPLKARDLFGLDVDNSIWIDDDMLGTEDQQVPKWLGDDRTREGIVALLRKDRALEEAERVKAEVRAMSEWLRGEMTVLTSALSCLGSSMFLPL